MRPRALPAATRLVAALVALAAIAVAVPPAAYAHAPAAPGRQDESKVWAVRPAGVDGRPHARTHFTLQSTPGGKVTDRVYVTNLSKEAVTFAIYGTDAFNTETGQFDLLAADRKPSDIGSWMVFPNNAITISAGGSVAVPFEVNVPATAEPGDHAGGVVVSLLTLSNGTVDKVHLDTRVAVRVYMRIPGLLRPRLGVGPVTARYTGTANPFGTGKVDVSWTVTNPGNIRLQSHPTITVKGPFGAVLAKRTPKDLPELLPNQSATFSSTVDGVFPSGPLTVSVSLAPFTDPQQPVGQAIPAASGEAYVWAVPWTLLVLVLVLLAGLGTWLVRRRRRKVRLGARTRKAPPPARDKPAKDKSAKDKPAKDQQPVGATS